MFFDKLILLGFTILRRSLLLMYEKYYDTLQPQKGECKLILK